MSELPEGIDQHAVLVHAATMGLIGELINAASRYMNAEGGSLAEQAAEDALGEMIHDATSLPAEAVGNALLALSSLIIAICEPADVQQWFDHQADQIGEALGNAD